MKNLKSRIFATTLLSAIALTQPAQLRAMNLSPNQKFGLGFVAGIATTITIPVLIIRYMNRNNPIMMSPKQLDAYAKKISKNWKTTHAHEQITVKKGEAFTIERKANIETGQIWRLHRYPHDIAKIGVAGRTFKNPGIGVSTFFSFYPKNAGVYEIVFQGEHTIVPAPYTRLIDYVTVTVTVEDDTAQETTPIAPTFAQADNSCPIEIDGKKPFILNPDQPRDFYIPLNPKQEFTVAAHKKADTLKYKLIYENLAPNCIESLADKDVFHFTAPAEYNGRLRIYLEEHKQDGSIEKEYRIIVMNL